MAMSAAPEVMRWAAAGGGVGLERDEGGKSVCTYGASCGDGAEFEDTFECGVVFSYENWECG
jgi:hypothetical protein